MTANVTIGEAAKRTGVKTETIRFYERIGLIPAPLRTGGGHRVYDDGRVERLRFIRRARELGFAVQQVRSLLTMVDEPGHTCDEVSALALEHLGSVRRRIEDLRVMERVLAETVTRCAGGTVPHCPIIDALQPHWPKHL